MRWFVGGLLAISLLSSEVAWGQVAGASQDNPLPVALGENLKNIAANGTTVLASRSGWLDVVCINTKGTTANTLTIFDNTAGSGTKIATIDTTSGVVCLRYQGRFAIGLTVVMATGVAADVTIGWRVKTSP